MRHPHANDRRITMTGSTDDAAFWTHFSKVFSGAMGLNPSEVFNPPASDEAIRQAEAHLGFRLPPDLRAAYGCFDGTSPFRKADGTRVSGMEIVDAFYPWNSLSQALERWDWQMETAESVPETPYARYDENGSFVDISMRVDGELQRCSPRPNWRPTHWPVFYDRRHFPLGKTSHFNLVVDMNPREGGVSGQMLQWLYDDEGPTWFAPGVGAYCQRLCESIEGGTLVWDEGWLEPSTGRRLGTDFVFEFDGFPDAYKQ
jgi:cell wall assembly regulator SMI1